MILRDGCSAESYHSSSYLLASATVRACSLSDSRRKEQWRLIQGELSDLDALITRSSKIYMTVIPQDKMANTWPLAIYMP